MPTSYTIKPLHPDQFDQVYPLIQLATKDASMAEWRTFAAALMGGDQRTAPHGEPPQTGIISLQTAAGHVFGLFCFSVEHDLKLGRTLDVTNFVVLTPARTELAIDLMLEEMDRLGYRHGCTCVRIEPLSTGAAVHLRREALVRTLASPQDPT